MGDPRWYGSSPAAKEADDLVADLLSRTHRDHAALVDLDDEASPAEQAAWERVASDDDRVGLFVRLDPIPLRDANCKERLEGPAPSSVWIDSAGHRRAASSSSRP